MSSDEQHAHVLTIDEVAAFLRVDSETVRELIDTGQLAAFTAGAHVRVLFQHLLDFLARSLEQQQLHALQRNLADPRAWARTLETAPDFAHEIESQDFQPDTFGRFLQEALARSRAESRSENVIDLSTRRLPDT